MAKLLITILFLCSAAVSQGGKVSQSSEPLSFTGRTITTVEGPPPLQNDIWIMAADGAKMAHISKDGTVVVEKPYALEEVLVLALRYMEWNSTRTFANNQADLQACMAGWEHSLKVMGDSSRRMSQILNHAPKAGAQPATSGKPATEKTK